jgi:ribonuclease HI
MELLAVIVALEELKVDNSEVHVYSDSRYVCDAIEKGWLFQWQRTGFKKKKNIDLWERFLLVFPKHKLKFHWIKGHSSIVENEKCDKLAVQASQQDNLAIDDEYELKNGL